MASGQISGFKRFLLWDYPRASWQYDVMVALILAFIFLTPREVFRDQPRASNVTLLPMEHGAKTFWIESDLLLSLPEQERGAKVETILRRQFGWRETVVRVEPIFGPEHEVKGYMAYTKP